MAFHQGAPLALKVPSASGPVMHDAARRAQRECQILAALQHPCIVAFKGTCLWEVNPSFHRFILKRYEA